MSTAAIYARISDDRDGGGLGVARQEADCRRLVEQKGWRLSGLYIDNDVSASNGQRRPQYERLLADLEAGSIDAVCVWDLDRLHRRPIELERFLDLADRRGIALASVGGDADLATVQGRLTARIKGSVARAEAEQISRRVCRKLVENAEAGSPHGRRAYGYTRVVDLDSEGRRRSRDVVDQFEAEVIRSVAARIISGDSLRSIVGDLNRRGVASPSGGQWKPVQLRAVVTRYRNLGMRVHRGEVVGRASWPAVLDQSTFDAVVAVLNDPGRKTATGSARKHLLSGLAKCGVCGEPMRVATAGASKIYKCQARSCVSRNQLAVDQLVTAVTLGRLAMPDATGLFVDDEDQDRQEAVLALAQLRARLDGAADSYAEGQIDVQQLSRITERLRPEVRRLEQISRRVPQAPILEGLLGADDLDSQWASLPLARKRAVIDLLMSIRVLPVPRHGVTVFDPTSISFEWKGK